GCPSLARTVCRLSERRASCGSVCLSGGPGPLPAISWSGRAASRICYQRRWCGEIRAAARTPPAATRIAGPAQPPTQHPRAPATSLQRGRNGGEALDDRIAQVHEDLPRFLSLSWRSALNVRDPHARALGVVGEAPEVLHLPQLVVADRRRHHETRID